MGQDYYKVLGVDRGATDEQLRSAYKKQAVKWHPDKNMNQREAAEERFKLIAGRAAAGTVLSPDPRTGTMQQQYSGTTCGSG
jgi:DnaJ family protein B protein 4